jgi:hypothetical protein
MVEARVRRGRVVGGKRDLLRKGGLWELEIIESVGANGW